MAEEFNDDVIKTPEDMQKAVQHIVNHITHEMGIHSDTEILQVITFALAGCVIMLAHSVSVTINKDFDELKQELLEVAVKELRHQVATIKIAETSEEKGSDGDKPLVLN